MCTVSPSLSHPHFISQDVHVRDTIAPDTILTNVGVPQTAFEERKCEHDTVTLTCSNISPTAKIEVLKASYGRAHGPEVCPHSATSNQNCHAATSMDTVKNTCNGKTVCTMVASNSVFGDPCGGTYKYLTVSYQCV